MNVLKSANGRLCCKSRKLQGSDFFAKTRNGKQSTICIISITLPKSHVSFTRGDEVPPQLTHSRHYGGIVRVTGVTDSRAQSRDQPGLMPANLMTLAHL